MAAPLVLIPVLPPRGLQQRMELLVVAAFLGAQRHGLTYYASASATAIGPAR